MTAQQAGEREATSVPGRNAGVDSLLSVRNLQTHFFSREGVVKAVDGVSFDIKPGEILGIAGESGCGKSVTSQSILRILPRNGQIIETIRIHQDVSKEEARDQAIEMLRRVGMPNPARNIEEYTFNLSGGMRQRAMVALSLSCRPKLLIADEPTTAVDVTIQAQMLELLRDIQADLGMAIIMITHDLGVIAELTDRVMIMYLGKEVEHGTVEDVFHRPQHPYTRGLLASIPKMEPGRVEIEPIEGVVPNPYAMPTGCKFHTRCPEYIAGVCEKRDPPLTAVRPGHEVSCYLYGGREELE